MTSRGRSRSSRALTGRRSSGAPTMAKRLSGAPTMARRLSGARAAPTRAARKTSGDARDDVERRHALRRRDPGTPREQSVAGMGDALDRSATLRPDGAGRGHGRGPRVVPNRRSATVVVRAAGDRLVFDLPLEGQSADSARQRVDAVGLLRCEPDGIASARSTTGARDCAGWRVDPVHRQRATAVPVVSNGVQHRRRSAHDDGDRPGVSGTRRPAATGGIRSARRTAHRGDRDLLLRQHRIDCRRHCSHLRSQRARGLARRVFLERRQLHGGGDRRGRCRGRDRTRRALAGRAVARACLPDLQDLPGLHRASRGSRSPRPRSPPAASGNHRCALAGSTGGAGAGGGEGPARGHRRRADAPRGRSPGTARARARSARQRGGRQPSEGSVPRHRFARAADPSQRHPRLGGHAALARDRRLDSRSRRPLDLRQCASAVAHDRRTARRGADCLRQAAAGAHRCGSE